MMRARTACLAIVILALICNPVAAQPPKEARKTAEAAPSGIQVPQPEVLLALIRSAMIGLDHANRTGNYSVLRELGGPVLQQHSSAQLSDAFASLRASRIDLLPAAIIRPQLTEEPTISPQGLLQLAGFFPTQPNRIQFRIVYQPVNGQWKLAGMNVGLSAAPAAAASVEPATPARKAAEPRAAKAAPAVAAAKTK